jgi:endonuclease-8
VAEGDTILQLVQRLDATAVGETVAASASRIYRRRGGVCPRCRGPISSRGQGDDNRTTYWCPQCQA